MKERRIERLEKETGVAGAGDAPMWIHPHPLDRLALRFMAPEPVEKIRDAYAVPEGMALNWEAAPGEGERCDGVHVVAAAGCIGYRDPATGAAVRVEEAPIVESLELTDADAHRLRWMRFLVHFRASVASTLEIPTDEDPFRAALRRAARLEVCEGWLKRASAWWMDQPAVSLADPPAETPKKAIPSPPSPPGQTWAEAVEAVATQRRSLNPWAIPTRRRGTPEEYQALALAEWLARRAEAVEAFLERESGPAESR